MNIYKRPLNIFDIWNKLNARLITICAILLFLCLLNSILFTTKVSAESLIDISGEIHAAISEDLSSGMEQNVYYILDDSEKPHQLFFNNQAPKNLKTGDFVKVEGSLINDETWGRGILVSKMLILASAQKILTNVTGERRALVMVVNFLDAPAECNTAKATELMWTGARSVNGLFKESSFNTLNFISDTDQNGNPDAINITISENIGSQCNYQDWVAAADTAATNTGVDLSLYQHRIYFIPNSSNCNWGGIAGVGCKNFCRTLVRTCGSGTLAHELGHNLGLGHARTDINNDGEKDCEYCDTSGIMGYSPNSGEYRHFNAPHKEYLGWIPPERLATITENGQHSILANEADPNTLSFTPPSINQIIRTAIPGEEETYYYLSYRAQLGDYSGKLLDKHKRKIHIHRQSGRDLFSYFVATVGESEIWSDGNGVSIKLIEGYNTHAEIDLQVKEELICSISGLVQKNGKSIKKKKRKKMTVHAVNLDNQKKFKSRIKANGLYTINECDNGNYKIQIKTKKKRKKNKKKKKRVKTVTVNEQLLANGPTTYDIDL